MGWLQGMRYKNLLQLNQVPNELSEKFEALHVANLPSPRTRQDVAVITGNNVGNGEQDVAEAPLNEVEKLLEATFGRKGHEKVQRGAERGTQQSADPSSARVSEHQRALQDTDLNEYELPLISMEEVTSKKLATGADGLIDQTISDCLWVVVDNVVYDCSDFIEDHPGGKQVILSFVGEDCSWQFWRFHSRSEMEQYGRPLRIGRTAGVSNRFEQRPKYVGLRMNRQDEW